MKLYFLSIVFLLLLVGTDNNDLDITYKVWAGYLTDHIYEGADFLKHEVGTGIQLKIFSTTLSDLTIEGSL